MDTMTISGLTVKQEKAARLIVNGSKTTDKGIADKLGVKVSKLRSWKKDIKFKLRVLQLIETNSDIEKAYRIKRVSVFLSPVYKEIRKRLREKDSLEGVSLKELLRMMVILHNELRSDNALNQKFLSTPKDLGESNTPGEDEREAGLEEMSDLYEDDRKKSANDKAKVIPMQHNR